MRKELDELRKKLKEKNDDSDDEALKELQQQIEDMEKAEQKDDQWAPFGNQWGRFWESLGNPEKSGTKLCFQEWWSERIFEGITKLLLVNLGFFMCHIYWSKIC